MAKWLDNWNENRTSQIMSIQELFEKQVEDSPDEIALVFLNSELTYRELNNLSNQLALELIQHGVGPETLIGILFERSFEMVVAVLGVLKAGGAYLPLDPSYPCERLNFMLGHAKPASLITNPNSMISNLSYKGQIIDFHIDLSGIRRLTKNLTIVKDLNSLAYLTYTSGSSGMPKGVLSTHKGVINYLEFLSETFKLTSDHVVLQLAAFSFDASVKDILGPLTSGAKLILPSADEIKNPVTLAKLMKKHAVTSILSIVPTRLNMFVNTLQKGGINCDNVKLILVSGEVLTWQDIDNTRKVFGKCTNIVNLYGPTEGTITSTFYMTQEKTRKSIQTPIGVPIPNQKVYILDELLNKVSVGQPGEMYIGGCGISRGYQKDSYLTAERFVPNPFGKTPGDRLYRTGDWGRLLEDGNIDFIGRKDRQVKMRGFRVELEEIEVILKQNQLIQTAICKLDDGLHGEKRIIAYIVPRSLQMLTSSKLYQYLKRKLPDYMIPSAFVFISEVPLNPNGKIDYDALPSHSSNRPSLNQKYVKYRNAIEKDLCVLWEDVLGISNIGIFDGFFELGGNSLSATRLVSRISEHFNLELSLKIVLNNSTISQQAKEIELNLKNSKNKYTKITRISQSSLLSYAQRRLWFLYKMDPLNTNYNESFAIKIRGKLDQEILEKSLNELVKRHDALRTRFLTLNDKPYATVDETLTIRIKLIDHFKCLDTHSNNTCLNTDLMECVVQEANIPFILETGPLIRATLFLIDKLNSLLLLTTHHIISDGWSDDILFDELTKIYKCFKEKSILTLPLPSVRYSDFVIWQREMQDSELYQTGLDYWRKQLDNSPITHLPTYLERPNIQTFRGKTKYLNLKQPLVTLLRELSSREEVTLFITMLTAFNIILFKYTGQEDIVVGSPVANRSRLELERVVGFFINMLILRVKVSGNPSFLEMLHRVRSVATEAYLHQDIPFDKLVEELRIERDPSRNPLYQVVFSFQNIRNMTETLNDISFSRMYLDQRTSKVDFSLSIQEHQDEINIVAVYNPDVYDEEIVGNLLENFETILEQIVVNPLERISKFRVLSRHSRTRQIEEYHANHTDISHDECFFEVFEKQVEQTPNAIALVYEGKTITYIDLNSRANKLAHYLQSLGVGPEVIVGVCISRSIEIIVAILGILKAGGAYLPLDSAYPKERLAYMINDSRVKVILTQEKLQFNLPIGSYRTVCIDSEWELIDQLNDQNPEKASTQNNLALVIYTSGSSGSPKGVMLQHNGLMNMSNSQIDIIGSHNNDNVLQYASLSFDASFFDIALALRVGATLYMGDRENLMPGSNLIEFLNNWRITKVNFTPSVLNALAQFNLPTVDTIVLGGEAVSQDLVKRWGTGYKLFNCYGPTETSVITTVSLCNLTSNKPTIGKPIQNMHIYILDTNMEIVPTGVIGEIYISGIGVARGYVNKPELTAERFLPNPFSNKLGDRMYKSGDQARYLPDGQIEFVGRLDNQVKIRGFRIEPEEIESVLKQHYQVQDAIIFVNKHPLRGSELTAFIIPKDKQSTVHGIRMFLKEKLPDYMIPSVIVPVNSFPLTPNGKIDYTSLAIIKSDFNCIMESEIVERPSSGIETQIANIWSEVLGINSVDINDNFFDLGGHSLLLIQLQSKINKLNIKEVSIIDLFKFPTVKLISDYLSNGISYTGNINDVKSRIQMRKQFLNNKMIKKENGNRE